MPLLQALQVAPTDATFPVQLHTEQVQIGSAIASTFNFVGDDLPAPDPDTGTETLRILLAVCADPGTAIRACAGMSATIRLLDGDDPYWFPACCLVLTTTPHGGVLSSHLQLTGHTKPTHFYQRACVSSV